ncbi:hypothetical protein BpHYR1_040757 [Brachionus plicatilis]|uniref:Uncharacterized protein n=1 Tax=Brachionus plicatilis TaxID=10195 RepID=A0A3M7PSW6_BRAPC|nr:hypothetical protein BpHYR1_040757 [Brachionus plicatilis]
MWTHPARPLDSILLASVTSLDQTSKRKRLPPMKPHRALPAHLYTALGVVLPAVQTPAHTVVAVAQCADLFAAGLLAQPVESGVQVVEQKDELLGSFVGAHARKADYVGEQYADLAHRIDEQRSHLVHAVHIFSELLGLAEHVGEQRWHYGLDHALRYLLVLLRCHVRLVHVRQLHERVPFYRIRGHQVQRRVQQNFDQNEDCFLRVQIGTGLVGKLFAKRQVLERTAETGARSDWYEQLKWIDQVEKKDCLGEPDKMGCWRDWRLFAKEKQEAESEHEQCDQQGGAIRTLLVHMSHTESCSCFVRNWVNSRSFSSTSCIASFRSFSASLKFTLVSCSWPASFFSSLLNSFSWYSITTRKTKITTKQLPYKTREKCSLPSSHLFERLLEAKSSSWTVWRIC